MAFSAGETLTLRCDAPPLGAGTSGRVLAIAADTVPDGRRYAVKRVGLAQGSLRLAQFVECQLHSSLPRSDAVVEYLCAWTCDDTLNILLERVDSELWDGLFSEASEPWMDTARRRLDWGRTLLQAVECLHAHGVAHRDISPWNCFLSGHRLKLGDFGLACRCPPSGSPSALGGLFGMVSDGCAPLDESAVGSLYSAPELGSDAGYEAKEVDVYSAGMTLFALWHGVVCAAAVAAGNAVPLDGEEELTSCVERLKGDGTLPDVWKRVGGSMGALVLRMVNHEPQARPSAGECLGLLHRMRVGGAGCVTCEATHDEPGAAKAQPPRYLLTAPRASLHPMRWLHWARRRHGNRTPTQHVVL